MIKRHVILKFNNVKSGKYEFYRTGDTYKSWKQHSQEIYHSILDSISSSWKIAMQYCHLECIYDYGKDFEQDGTKWERMADDFNVNGLQPINNYKRYIKECV